MLVLLASLLLAWLGALGRGCWVLWIATGLAYGTCCLLLWRWKLALPVGMLVWTGLLWRVEPEGLITPDLRFLPDFRRCELVLDLQFAFLLRLSDRISADDNSQVPKRRELRAANSTWVWARKHATVKDWHALRAAVIWAQQQTSQDAMLTRRYSEGN